jgi:hypothetical protein
MEEWLVSPIGVEFSHAVIVLMLALAAYLSFLAHRTASATGDKIDAHVAKHDTPQDVGGDALTQHNP